VKPKSGELVLITGAAGSVGRTAVYVARQHGAKVIAGVRAKQKAAAQSLGAHSVVAIGGGEIDTLPQLDAIGDTVNGETIAKLVPKIRTSGRLASVLGKLVAAERAGIEVIAVFAKPDPDRLYQLALI
jgi:NADPH:quinone reductase-like Zn-dependent oxidoreductase